MLIGQRSGAAVLWSVQGDAAAGVEVGDKGRRRRSSCGLVHRKEEEESEKERGENERRVRGLIYKTRRTNNMRENRGGRKWISDGAGASIFRGTIKRFIKIWVL